MLELAKVKELLGKPKEAKRLYKLALRIPNIPLIVRDNINNRINNIRGGQGFIDYSVSFVTDDNPLNYTDAKEVSFAGLNFQLSPPQENKTVYGLEHSLLTLSHFGKSKYSLITKHLYLDYSGRELDELLSKIILQRNLSHRRIGSVFIGREAEFNNEGTVYYKDNIGFNLNEFYVFSVPVASVVTLGHLEVPDFNYLNKNTYELSALLRFSKYHGIPADIALIAEKHKANEKPYSYERFGLGLSSKNYFHNDKISYQINFMYLRDIYDDVDPLFRITRQDKTGQLNGELTHQRWKIFSRQVYLGFRYKKNISNLSYFEYDSSGLYFRIN